MTNGYGELQNKILNVSDIELWHLYVEKALCFKNVCIKRALEDDILQVLPLSFLGPLICLSLSFIWWHMVPLASLSYLFEMPSPLAKVKCANSSAKRRLRRMRISTVTRRIWIPLTLVARFSIFEGEIRVLDQVLPIQGTHGAAN